MRHRLLRSSLATARSTLAAATLAACAVELGTPPTLSLTCAAPTDCPADLVCVVAAGVCLRPDNGCIEKVGDIYAPTRPGNPCTLADGVGGICLTGTCQASVCGDTFVDEEVLLEECDHGDANDDSRPNGCRTDCRRAFCGDGVIDDLFGEQCDDGASNGPLLPCSSTCTAYCGDGEQQPSEGCDDGNTGNGDGCDRNCTPTGCGNDILTAPEQCDDGNLTDDDGCDSNCTFTACGNGIETAGEVCDDGDRDAGDGCSFDCLSEETCGNGYVDLAADETCDLGDANSDDADAQCRTNCRFARCGDGVLDPSRGEACDGAALGSGTCEDFGYYAGTLGCVNCNYVAEGFCTGTCNDGILHPGEACDQAAPPGETCLDYGFDRGLLGCTEWCTPGFEGCGFIGFRSIAPTALAYDDLYDVVWVGDDVFVVGETAGILHYDGTDWQLIPWPSSPTVPCSSTNIIRGVWANSPTDVWAVSDSGCVLRYNGTALDVVHDVGSANLNAVYASSATNVWVVGTDTTVVNYNGSIWTPWTPPAGTIGGEMFDIHGVGADPIWIAADSESFRFTAGSWTRIVPSVSDDYYGVHVVGASDVKMVSHFGYLHSYVSGWASYNLASGPLRGVGASDANDALLVGDTGRVYANTTTWKVQPSGTAKRLEAVAVRSGEAIVVGETRTIRHYNGASWAVMPTAAGPPTFTDIWGVSSQALIAPGLNEALPHLSGVWGSNGDAWADDGLVVGGVVFGGFTAVHGTTADNVWLTGNKNGSNSVVYRDTSLSDLDFVAVAVTGAANGADFNDVWAANGTTAYFAIDSIGGGLSIPRYTGSWSTQTIPSETRNLNGVWGFATNNVWAVGDGGIVARYTSTWAVTTPVTSPAPRWNDVWGLTANDVWAVGDDGEIMHYDGATWTRVPSPTLSDLQAVRGFASDDVFAAGDGATVLHWDGVVWVPVRAPAADYTGLWIDTVRRLVLASGDNGTVAVLAYRKSF